jgi:thiol-disulfide isomerase/thioredoxin
MKKNQIASFIMLIFSVFCFSQTTIQNPKTGLNNSGYVKITKIVLSDTATVLSFNVNFTPNWWINIPLETYIQPVNSQQKYRIKYTEGIQIDKHFYMPESGKTSFKLYFDAIPNGTKMIDFYEEVERGWQIYDIALNENANKLILPKALYSNWFSATTGDLELSIDEKFVVYKNQLWTIDQYKVGKAVNAINLTSTNGKTTILYHQLATGNTCMFGESATEFKQYHNNSAEALKTAVIDNEPYKLPIFKLDTAIYCGYIKDYTSRVGIKTMSLSVNDIITGEQSTHLIKIDDNGYFSLKVPLYYPNLCYVRSSLYNGAVLLEPGKKLFQLLDHTDENGRNLFMSDMARTNTDLAKLENIRNFDYDKMRKNILDMTPVQYKAFCKEAETKEINALDSIMKNSKLSAKAYQIMQLETKYSSMSNMMSYSMNYESAYREKNKIPRTQRELDIKIDSLTVEYFDFINPETMNNSMAVIAPSYNSFINRLKYIEVIRAKNSYGLNLFELANAIEKEGIQLTENEKNIISKNREIEKLTKTPKYKAYIEKYGTRIKEFNIKYKLELANNFKENPKADNNAIYEYIKRNKIKLTKDETKLWKEIISFDNKQDSKIIRNFYSTYRDSINAFYKKHNDVVIEYFAIKTREARNENLKSSFGCEAGFSTDIMNAQDVTRKIVEEVLPVSEQKLKAMQQQFVTPFIAEYIAVCNNNSIAKIEANKKKTGFSINETPKTEADKVFDTIMEKYRGKVVYVDFWATWCGPCIGANQRIKPLKEEMDLSKVAFVYITDQSSPLNTWNNMIPDIKGEHYRVSQDEWNYLKAKFQINGIPHFVLVGKKGEVINPKLGFMENNAIKTLLEKHIND